jgi:2-polyprenyl-6-methoxyphenol hydroxylase-like FAD-dependent oxidoreductase
MRFATVPMVVSADGVRKDQQVWFITIDGKEIQDEPDPSIRRDKLLEAFRDWHDPIGRLVEATPPEEILMERAMAHKHSMSPVANFNGILSHIRQKKPRTTGNGPAIVFMGDAFMTIDPILAQGFTIGLEGAAALQKSLETGLEAPPRAEYPDIAFDPFFLRHELKERHDARLSRLIHLLRATELVQALGQPTTGTFTGMISRDILRPLMRFTPAFIKTPIFNFMLRYSLGLPQKSSTFNSASPSHPSSLPNPEKS